MGRGHSGTPGHQPVQATRVMMPVTRDQHHVTAQVHRGDGNTVRQSIHSSVCSLRVQSVVDSVRGSQWKGDFSRAAKGCPVPLFFETTAHWHILFHTRHPDPAIQAGTPHSRLVARNGRSTARTTQFHSSARYTVKATTIQDFHMHLGGNFIQWLTHHLHNERWHAVPTTLPYLRIIVPDRCQE